MNPDASDPAIGSSVAYADGFAVLGTVATWGGNVYSYDTRAGVSGAPERVSAPESRTTMMFGFGVAVSAEWLVVSSSAGLPPTQGYAGVVDIFHRRSGKWAYFQSLRSPPGRLDKFGRSVALRNNLLLIGAPLPDAVDGGLEHGGAVYVYSYD